MGATVRRAAGVMRPRPIVKAGQAKNNAMLVWRLIELMAPRTEPTTWLIAPAPCLPSASGILALGVLNLTLQGKRLGSGIYSIISPERLQNGDVLLPEHWNRSSILSWEAFGRPTIAHAGMEPSGRSAKEHDAPAAARSRGRQVRHHRCVRCRRILLAAEFRQARL